MLPGETEEGLKEGQEVPPLLHSAGPPSLACEVGKEQLISLRGELGWEPGTTSFLRLIWGSMPELTLVGFYPREAACLGGHGARHVE